MRIKDGINPIDRVNTIAAESESSSEENETAEEIQQTTEMQRFEEFNRGSGGGTSFKREKKSSKNAQKAVLRTMMAVSAVVVLTVSPISIFEPIFGPVLDPVFDPIFGSDAESSDGDLGEPPYEGGLTGSFSEVVASEDTIWYTVSVDGLQGDETLTVDLTNKFTDRSSTIGGDGSSGSQTGLKPGMTYTLTLRDGGHTLASVTVETEREIVTFFHLEDAGCTCLLDGMFHFSAEIIDGGVQHGFTATLTDWYGNVSTVSIDPEAGEYSIPVTGTALLGDSAILTISCIRDLEDGGTELVVLHESEYMI